MERLRAYIATARDGDGDEPHQVMLFAMYKDVKDGSTLLNTLGYADSGQEPLLEEARKSVLNLRRSGQEVVTYAPLTLRLLAVAHAMGVMDLSAKLQAVDGEVIAQGWLVSVVFTDMSTAYFIGSEDNHVREAGASAPVFGEKVRPAVEADPTELGLPGDARSVNAELALLITAMTATPDELEML